VSISSDYKLCFEIAGRIILIAGGNSWKGAGHSAGQNSPENLIISVRLMQRMKNKGYLKLIKTRIK